jgi:predicted DNA-binding transcriptional regulator YafY
MNVETTIRYLHLLRYLPKYPSKRSLNQIRDHLYSLGYKVTDRTIQRDLLKLETPFGLLCDARSKPYGWSFPEHAKALDIASIDKEEAFSLMLIREYLINNFDTLSFPRMNNIFDKAEKTLNAYQDPHQKLDWKQKIIFKSVSHNYLPPKVDVEVYENILGSLINEKQFQAKYESRRRISEKVYNPLSIIAHGVIRRLVCTRAEDPSKVLHLPLQRFKSFEALDSSISIPASFNLEDYVNSGEVDYLYKKDIQLILRFNEKTGRHLVETPFSSSQQLSLSKDKKIYSLKVNTNDTETLRRWILGFGSNVTVLKPKYLSDFVNDECKKILENTSS